MKYQTQKAYLFASGVLENGTSEEIAAAKKAYRKAYLQEKKRVFRERHRTVSLSFPKREAVALEATAGQHNMKLAPFLKACIRAYNEQQFLPLNTEEIQKVELLLRAIGNNINQIAKRCNAAYIPPSTAMEQSYALLQTLDTQLSEALRNPEHLDMLLWQSLLATPAYVLRVEELLTAAKEHHAQKEIRTNNAECT